MRKHILVIFTIMLLNIANAHAEVVYFDRASFNASVGTTFTDDFSNPGYGTSDDATILTDAQMSAVIGQTSFKSTFWPDQNIVSHFGGVTQYYCAGCNGSFQLDFMSTSLTSNQGIYGFSIDFSNFYGNPGELPYVATVSFGDGSSKDYSLDHGALNESFYFFGITSPLSISRVHFGLAGGLPYEGNSFQLKDITIASAVPESEVYAMLLAGLSLLGFMAHRKKETTV